MAETLDDIFIKIGLGKFHFYLLLICCILETSEGIEMMILSFIGPMLTCRWKISIYELSFLTTAVFIGMIIGSIFHGKLSDIYGRKPAFLICCVFLMYSGFLSALSPVIEWFIFMRSLIGFNVGGATVSLFALIVEFSPINHRGNFIILVLSFWSLGAFYVTFLSYYLAPKLGWRIFLLVANLPLLITIPFCFWIPESPRFLILQNKKSEALKIINKLSKMNNGEHFTNVEGQTKTNSSILDLLHPNYFSTTLITFYLWLTAAFSYYGIVLIITQINEFPRKCIDNWKLVTISNAYQNSSTDNSCCMSLTWETYKNSYISITGELIFFLTSILFVNLCGRKLNFLIFFFVNVLGFLLLNVCMSSVGTTIILFILRGSIFNVFNFCFIYTSEVFPTSIKSVAIGLCNIGGRLGAILSPFIVNIFMVKISFFGGSIFFIAMNCIAFICVLALPYETKNRKLFQTIDEKENESEKINQIKPKSYNN